MLLSEINPEQIEEFKRHYPVTTYAEEGGHVFFKIPKLMLPDGCDPVSLDVLFCPSPIDGYSSRIYFAEKFTKSGISLNWNGSLYRIGRSWFAYSLRITASPQFTLLDIFCMHLGKLVPETGATL